MKNVFKILVVFLAFSSLVQTIVYAKSKTVDIPVAPKGKSPTI